jgi:hypothetical protein
VKAAIAWTLMFRVKNRQKADREIERAEALIGVKLPVVKCEPYWKDSRLWCVETVTALGSSDPHEQIAECLLLANKLATGWHVLGPALESEGRLGQFTGIFDARRDHTQLSSLAWAEFGVFAQP